MAIPSAHHSSSFSKWMARSISAISSMLSPIVHWIKCSSYLFKTHSKWIAFGNSAWIHECLPNIQASGNQINSIVQWVCSEWEYQSKAAYVKIGAVSLQLIALIYDSLLNDLRRSLQRSISYS